MFNQLTQIFKINVRTNKLQYLKLCIKYILQCDIYNFTLNNINICYNKYYNNIYYNHNYIHYGKNLLKHLYFKNYKPNMDLYIYNMYNYIIYVKVYKYLNFLLKLKRHRTLRKYKKYYSYDSFVISLHYYNNTLFQIKITREGFKDPLTIINYRYFNNKIYIDKIYVIYNHSIYYEINKIPDLKFKYIKTSNSLNILIFDYLI